MEIALPSTALRPVLHLDDQSGRDQVACVTRTDWSAFERPLPAILHSCVGQIPGLVIDVGANTGYYALLAAVSGRRTRVLAFEPDASVRIILCENIGLNDLQGRIAVSELALSDRCGPAWLYVPMQEHGLIETSCSLEANFKPAHSAIHPVTASTLDAFLRRLRYVFSRVSVMKIDVEGHEAAVLRGARKTIRRWRPIVFVEVLPKADIDFLTGFIAANRYLDFPLQTGPLVACHEVKAVTGSWNHALVPAEKAQLFLGCTDA